MRAHERHETAGGTAPRAPRPGESPAEPVACAIRDRARQIGGSIATTFAGGPEAPRGLTSAVPARRHA